MFDIRDLETIAEMTDLLHSGHPGTWTIKDIDFQLVSGVDGMYMKCDHINESKYVWNGVEIWEFINYVFK